MELSRESSLGSKLYTDISILDELYTNHQESGICKIVSKKNKEVDIAYNLYGTGSRKVMFVMGLNSTGSFWGYQAKYFGSLPDYQVCLFDNRGIGKSSTPPGPYTTRLLASDAIKLLHHLGWEEHVHLVGVSMGGMVCQIMATKRPNMFSSVVMTSTYFLSTLFIPTPDEFKLVYKKFTGNKEANVKSLIKICFPKPWLKSDHHAGVTNMDFMTSLSCQFPTYRNKVGEYSQLTSALTHNAPIYQLQRAFKNGIRPLIIHGTKDKVIRSYQASAVASYLGSPLVLFRNSGHMLMIEREMEYNCLLRAHFEAKDLDYYIHQTSIPIPDYVAPTESKSPLIFTRCDQLVSPS